MKANKKQKVALLDGLLSVVQSKALLVAEASEENDDIDSIADLLNTAQCINDARSNFKANNDVSVLCKAIREGLVTMVYEDVFEELGDSCEDAGLDCEKLIELS
jgi:F0F1-type ATP synthase epsilon subunit